MDTELARMVSEWRGERSHLECAEALGIPVATFRKYLYGERCPNPLALAELKRRMQSTTVPDETEKQKKAAAPVAKSAARGASA